MFTNEGKLSRRRFLKITASAGVAAAMAPLANISAFSEEKPGDAPKSFGVIWKVEGKISVNDRKAKKGSAFEIGDVLKTEKRSQAWVILESNAIIMMKQLSSVKIERAVDENRQAREKGVDLKLDSGSILNYVHKIDNKPYPFSVKTTSASAGVRGTTFFVEIMDDKQTYVCDCYGLVDITSTANPEITKNILSSHHKAYIVGEQGKTEDEIMKSAGLIDHTDQEIFEMRDMFKKATGFELPEEIPNYPQEGAGNKSDSGY